MIVDLCEINGSHFGSNSFSYRGKSKRFMLHAHRCKGSILSSQLHMYTYSQWNILTSHQRRTHTRESPAYDTCPLFSFGEGGNVATFDIRGTQFAYYQHLSGPHWRFQWLASFGRIPRPKHNVPSMGIIIVNNIISGRTCTKDFFKCGCAPTDILVRQRASICSSGVPVIPGRLGDYGRHRTIIPSLIVTPSLLT
jgi:hypothetical protein